MSDLKADGAAAEAFLRLFHGDGALDLTAIDPDEVKDLQGRTFTNGSRNDAVGWIKDRNADVEAEKFGIYHHVNPLIHAVASKGKGAKAPKTNVRAVEYFHVDLDPGPREPTSILSAAEHLEEEQKRILARLSKYPLKPTVITKSGNGYQAFWKLASRSPLMAM